MGFTMGKHHPEPNFICKLHEQHQQQAHEALMQHMRMYLNNRQNVTICTDSEAIAYFLPVAIETSLSREKTTSTPAHGLGLDQPEVQLRRGTKGQLGG